MSNDTQLPVSIKAVYLLIGIFLLTSILYIAQDIIIPFIFAGIIAISISPAVNYLVRKNVNLIVSISIVLMIFLILFFAMIALITVQAGSLNDAMPILNDKLHHTIDQTISWFSSYFNISTRKINDWIDNLQYEALKNSNMAIGSTLTTIGGLLSTIFIAPVYVFMLLYYQSHLIEFTHKISGAHNNERVNELLSETKAIIQSYIAGIGIEFIIVSIFNIVGLFLLGIEYAILLGILGGLLNIIPYIGGIIGVIIFMVIALVTKAPISVLYVAVMYSIIQFIDNNYIVPKIIGSKVKLNGLFSLIAVVLGAALWGMPGMFLSIPLLAIVKLICDRVDPLKSYGFLLGDTETPSS